MYPSDSQNVCSVAYYVCGTTALATHSETIGVDEALSLAHWEIFCY